MKGGHFFHLFFFSILVLQRRWRWNNHGRGTCCGRRSGEEWSGLGHSTEVTKVPLNWNEECVFLRALKDNGEVSDWSRELGYAGIMRCRGDMLWDCTRTVRVISTCWTLMAISIFCLGCVACVLFKKVLLSSFSPFLDSYVGAWSCERESAMREVL